MTNCREETQTAPFQEIIKRFISPFYLIVLCLIANLIITRSKDEQKFNSYKFIIFVLGVTTIIISEISIKYATVNFFQNFYIYAMPVVFFILIYLYFVITLKKNNLINQ